MREIGRRGPHPAKVLALFRGAGGICMPMSTAEIADRLLYPEEQVERVLHAALKANRENDGASGSQPPCGARRQA